MSGAISFWCNAIALSAVVVVINCLLSSVFHKPLFVPRQTVLGMKETGI